MAIYGICPSKGCCVSYENERPIIGWHSARILPGSAGTGGNDSLPPEYRRVFQIWGPDSRFCSQCGCELVTAEVPLPPLGNCPPPCKRNYSEADLGATFCQQCGAPIDILDEVRDRYRRHVAIKKLLDLVPYLPL
jgi:hypothetical protein